MKKIIISVCLLLLLTGCTNTDNEESNNDADYNALNKTILDNEEYLSESNNFDINIVTNDLGDGTFRYYLIVDNPKIAMYDVVAMACDVKNINIDTEFMCPNVGIYEGLQYNMIPNQSNKDQNYIKGFSLSGISDTEDITLKIVVVWNNLNDTKKFKEFISITNVADETEVDSIEENINE